MEEIIVFSFNFLVYAFVELLLECRKKRIYIIHKKRCRENNPTNHPLSKVEKGKNVEYIKFQLIFIFVEMLLI